MNWIDKRDARESLELLGRLSELCAQLGAGPLSSHVNDFVKAKDYKSLVDYEIHYDYSSGVNDVLYARQILGFFQKLDFLDLGIDRGVVASRRFVQSEQMCRRANKRIRTLHGTPQLVAESHPRIAPVLHRAARKIADVLGPLPALDRLNFAFGPGANTNVKGALACPRAKLGVQLQCSANMTPTVGVLLEEVPLWTAHHAVEETEVSYITHVEVVPGKVIFVPKNAKTDRSIVVEPILNSFFQKGFGSYIKGRLLRSGVNLFDQSLNQRLAQRSSVDGSLATVDLSMASDCMCKELVYSLLPFDWADMLDQLRTATVSVPQTIVESLATLDPENRSMIADDNGVYLQLEKFSSMGNGYTFELESLIFYGICFAVCEELRVEAEVSVYGDDLIVPVSTYDLLCEVLEFIGFSTNNEKSFAIGPFRESCGADYLKGFDIRPFYQKTQVSDRNLYTMHNWFIRHGERELAAAVTRELSASSTPLYGPDGFGDGHLIGSYQLRQNRAGIRAGWCGGYFDTYALKPRSFSKLLPGDALLPVYSVYTRSGEESPTDPNIIRGSNGYAKVSIYTLAQSIFRAQA